MTYEEVMRGLIVIWGDFSTRIDATPLIEKLYRGKFRIEDYKLFLSNHRQQVVEGSRWIARAASSIDSNYADIRSRFLKHSIAEHKDYRMLEDNYVSIGGNIEDIRTAPKNIGTEALHAFMFQRSSLPNPFDLMGAMFIIEGLGQQKAGEWGQKIKEQLDLRDDQVSFLLYHAINDEHHMAEFDEVLQSGILDIDGMGEAIVKTAKIVARLYLLQIEEIGNV